MGRWLRRLLLGFSALIVLLALGIGGGYLWLRSSLPLVEGETSLPGLDADVTITRDDRGVPIIRAGTMRDAAFALGFLHAQDRLFQMDAMRRLGAGRLAEVIGPQVLTTDRLMRTLGLYRSAEAQWTTASPALKDSLGAYADGVNAYLDTHRGAWPPEFYLLGYEPEKWQPADSLVWGRLMALDLSANWQAEDNNRRLRDALPPFLFDVLVARPLVKAAANDGWRQPLNEASNSWVVGGLRTARDLPLIANDPHLGLSLPATWYLARMETPELTLTGATAPGLPFVIIGTNDHVAWTFTTTHSDTQDLFEERVVAGQPDRYETPDGPMAFENRQEVFRVKGEADVTMTIRGTRHGPVVSDLDIEPAGDAHVFALSWTALQPDDRTPEALLAMNAAQDAGALEVALLDFHAPQQNVVFADREGVTGFIAAGRVPERRARYMESRLPAPGWSGDYDWTGILPFSALPQVRGGNTDRIVTANNDIRPSGYTPFLTADWPEDARARQIQALLDQKPALTLQEAEAMQMDHHSAPLLAFVRSRQQIANGVDPTVGRLLADWDGSMQRDLAAPLIATLWLDRLAQSLLKDEMGQEFDGWWFWQVDRIEAVLADGRACDDLASRPLENCDGIEAKALSAALSDLTMAYGADPKTWHWGDSHRAQFAHPVFRKVPIVADWLRADLPTDGDFFTINRGTAMPPGDGVALNHVHGAGLRFVYDFDQAPAFVIAGGQSGNPLSPNYADWLTDWRDGTFRSIAGGADMLTLKPLRSAP